MTLCLYFWFHKSFYHKRKVYIHVLIVYDSTIGKLPRMIIYLVWLIVFSWHKNSTYLKTNPISVLHTMKTKNIYLSKHLPYTNSGVKCTNISSYKTCSLKTYKSSIENLCFNFINLLWNIPLERNGISLT
jgi:hypothetical protein